MNIFLLNKNLEVCEVLSSEGDVNSSPFFNDEYIQYLETGAETFEFEAPQTEFLEIGSYVVFLYNNEYKLFQISEMVDTHETNLVKKVYCEMAGLELNYEVLRPRHIASANVKQFFENVLSETLWEVGYVDEDINDVFTIDIEDYDTIYNTIQEWILKYECEISFRVEIKNNRVVKRYIDIFKQRGNITNFRFEYSNNIEGVIRNTNAFELCTALIGTGKDGLDFKSAVWSVDDGDPVDKPEGQDFIADETAFRLYNNNGSHLMGHFECDKESAYDILQATYKELKERSQPKVEYEVNTSLFDIEEVFIGDTIYVIDNEFKPNPLHLSARINELHISFTDNSNNKCIMSNFKTVKSKITDDMRSLANKLSKLESTTIHGVAKGGFLTSQVSLDNGKIFIENNLLDFNGREYYFDVKGKSYSRYINGLLTYDSRYVTQAFALDLEGGYIYTSQCVTETTPEHILISKIKLSDKSVVGHMRLFGFGHGSQIGLDKLDGVTKIWVECDGLAHVTTGKLFGTKICRLEFIDGAEYTTSAGNVYDLVPDARNIQVNVDVEGNRLSVKYITISNKNGINVYDLKSVINNSPRLLAKIAIPSWLETSTEPNQGHSVCGNMVYHYQGGETSLYGNNSRVTVLDFKGNVLSSQIITAGITEGISVREPEGIYVKKDGNYVVMYVGFSEGAWSNRKFHIYKYADTISLDYSKRGTFKHPNGYFSNIDEGQVSVNNSVGTSFLLYKDNPDSGLIATGESDQFIIGNIKSGKWYSNNIPFEVNENDCVIGEIENGRKLTLYTSSNDGHGMAGADGADGQDGKDAYFVELSNEFHSIPTDENGNNAVYDGCSTEIKLYRGDVRLTSGVEYSISAEENVIGTLIDDTYTVTSLRADTGYVDLSATYSNNTYTKRFSLSKNKQGFNGETPIIHWLSTSASCISKTTDGKFKPSSITFWSKKQEGNSSIEYYKGIFKIYESTDGDDYVLRYTSSEPDDTKAWSVSNNEVESLKCELYLSDGKTLIDQDIIHIVKDGTDGFTGADAKYVTITGDMIFRYEGGYSSTPKPSVITLTGTPFNLNSTEYRWYYRNEVKSEWTALTKYNGNTEIDITHNDSDIFANDSKTASIKFSVGDCEDIISLARLCDGTDGYFILLTNESHSVPCENNGDVIVGGLDDAKTQIFAYKGATEVSFTLKSKTDKGCTSSYNSATKTLTITSLSNANASVTLEISVDGATFTKVMTITKAIKGDTGAGVSILGTLPSEADLPNFGNIGDAYIIMGDLYVWSVNDNDWINVGQIKGDQGIQGVTGADGKTYYTWIKYSDNSNGNPMYDDPQDSSGIYRKYMGIAYNKEVQQESTNPSDYSWIKIVGEDGKDGESSYVANLTNDSHTIPSDENGNNANYTGCKTTIELCHGSTKITSGLTYTYSASTGVTGSGSNGTYTITGMSTDSGYVDLTVKYNNESYTKRFTVSKSRNGSDSYSVSLSNDSHVFSCDNNGNIANSVTINTSVMAFKGTSTSTPVIGTLPTVSGLTLTKDGTTIFITAKAGSSLAMNGSFEIPVTVNNVSFTKVFSWSKVKDGANGTNGSDGVDGIDGVDSTSYWLVSSSSVIGKNSSGVYNPTNITFTGKSQTGANDVVNYSGRFIIQESTNGTDFITKYTSSDNESSKTYTPTSGIMSLRVRLCKVDGTTTLLDEQLIPIVTDGVNGVSAVTTVLSNDSHIIPCDSSGTPTTFAGATTTMSVYVGTSDTSSEWTYSISTTNITGTASSNNRTYTVSGISSDVGYVDFTASRSGYSSISKRFTLTKAKNGLNGTDGTDGTSPILVTIDGQSYMKYIDTNTPPVPSSITLTCNAMEGSSQITPTYLWQYKSSTGEWWTFDSTVSTNDAKTYTLSYSSGAFINDVAQVRVRVTYKSVYYYAEHTVAKIYDNKYISKQEIFDKITEGGTNQIIYKDPDTGDIYINATYIKSGQLVADLIKGGVLTLGGTGESDLGDYGRLRVLDYTGENELASLDGGEMKIEELTSHNISVDEISVNKINCSTFAPSITETTKIYVHATNGSDDIEFSNGAIYKTLQCALNSIPKNLNGFTVDITLQSAVSENIVIRGFSSGTLNLYMNSKAIKGYVVVRDCSAQIFILGGLSTTDIADGLDNGSLRPNIQPSQLFSFGGYNYSFVAIGCSYVYVRSVDIFGKTGTTTNYCGGSTNGSNVYVQNVNAYASNSGWNVQNGGKLTTKETYGMCERLGYNIQLGGTCHICNGYSTAGETNTYTANGGHLIQGASVTFVTGSVGSNTNTTTNSDTSTYTATSGDSYKVKYSSWRKDNTVRQGDWSGYGLHKGCWFFGNQFTELKGKTIKSVKLTIKRQSGGNSGNTSFTLKMHNHSSRPSSAPTYLSTWSKSVSLAVGNTTTITITDSAVLTAIQNGTMKGFGVEVTSTSNSYYGILNPSLKAVVTY